MLTEVEGTIGFEDLVEGQSISETLDESTGIAKRVVIDWRSTRGGADLRPAIVIKGKDGKVLKLARGGDARYMLSVDAHSLGRRRRQGQAGRHPRPYLDRKRQDARHHRRSAAGGGTVRGPASPKDAAIIAEISGTIRFGRDYKNKRRISIEPMDKTEETREYLIPKGKHIHLQDGDVVEKGDFIVEGNPAPHDILAIKGIEELAAYLVNEIQEVYRLQGVLINDKHIEVIVRQMLQKVEITDQGETDMISGEQVDKIEFDQINEKAKEEGKKIATGTPVLLGITKASLQTRSFFSAASFQETTRVLTEAAVNGKVDPLEGLKENVIVGRLIPAGTGASMAKIREVAIKRDKLILDEREKQAAIVPPAPEAEPAGAAAGGINVHRRIPRTMKRPAQRRPFCCFVCLLRCRNNLCSSFLQGAKALLLRELDRWSRDGGRAGDHGTHMLDLAIVGGGPGGLMSAWYLKKKLGDLCRVTIYEASDRLGGKIVTRKFNSAPAMYEAGVAEIYDYSMTGPDPLRELIQHFGLQTIPMDAEQVQFDGELLNDVAGHAPQIRRQDCGCDRGVPQPLRRDDDADRILRGRRRARQRESLGLQDRRAGARRGGRGRNRKALLQGDGALRHRDRKPQHQRAQRAEELS